MAEPEATSGPHVDDTYLNLAERTLRAWEQNAVIPRHIPQWDRLDLVAAIGAAMQQLVETAQMAEAARDWPALIYNGKLVVRDHQGGPDRPVTRIDLSNAPRSLRLWL